MTCKTVKIPLSLLVESVGGMIASSIEGKYILSCKEDYFNPKIKKCKKCKKTIDFLKSM